MPYPPRNRSACETAGTGIFLDIADRGGPSPASQALALGVAQRFYFRHLGALRCATFVSFYVDLFILAVEFAPFCADFRDVTRV